MGIADVAAKTLRYGAAFAGAAMDKLLENLSFPYHTEQLAVLIREDVTVIELWYEISREYDSGEAKTKWKEENLERFDIFRTAVKTIQPYSKYVSEDLIVKYLSPTGFVGFAESKRPDLAVLLREPDGYRWMSRQIRQVAKELDMEKRVFRVLAARGMRDDLALMFGEEEGDAL